MRAGGSLETTNMIFGFGENKLQFIQFAEPDSDLDIPGRQKRWAKMKSLIGTNEAYQLATNWLVKLDVDLEALQKTHPLSVEQQFFYPGGNTSNTPVMLPRFEVRWGTNRSLPAVWVSIFGPTKKLIHIRMEDGSFSRRPNLIKIEHIERLLSLTNKDFANWSVIQKSNLVVEAASSVYRSFSFPEIAPLSSPDHNRQVVPMKPVGIKRDGITPRKRTKTVAPINPNP